MLPFPADRFVPVPDFYRLTRGGELLVYRNNTLGVGRASDIVSRPNMTGNDLYFFGNVSRSESTTIGSISVPEICATAITATLLSDGSVRVTARSGFTGIAWYDYRATHESGLSETGRVYLTVL
jgi:hypothetical protein